MLPDPFDVLEATLGVAMEATLGVDREATLGVDMEATLGVDARAVRLDAVRVVRVTGGTDHAPGNAVHHHDGLAGDDLGAALDDLDHRFPTGQARLVAPHDEGLAAAAVGRGHLHVSVIDVLLREDSGEDADTELRPHRGDLRLSAPGDDRAWHGITVLHRHAAPPQEDRARGAQDGRLRWWVDGLRQSVEHGRARVLRAERFGMPVAAAVLYWAPGVAVDGDHAGLAVVADVVVHPAHRNLGIARTLVDALVAQHLTDFPRARMAGLAEVPVTAGPPTAPTAPTRPIRFAPHARLLAVRRPAR